MNRLLVELRVQENNGNGGGMYRFHSLVAVPNEVCFDVKSQFPDDPMEDTIH